MSGGHFNCCQHHILSMAEDVRELIDENDSEELSDGDGIPGRGYTTETIAKFKEAEQVLRQAYVMVQRIDWLVSCDDGEDTFHRRWDDDLSALEQSE